MTKSLGSSPPASPSSSSSSAAGATRHSSPGSRSGLSPGRGLARLGIRHALFASHRSPAGASTATSTCGPSTPIGARSAAKARRVLGLPAPEPRPLAGAGVSQPPADGEGSSAARTAASQIPPYLATRMSLSSPDLVGRTAAARPGHAQSAPLACTPTRPSGGEHDTEQEEALRSALLKASIEFSNALHMRSTLASTGPPSCMPSPEPDRLWPRPVLVSRFSDVSSSTGYSTVVLDSPNSLDYASVTPETKQDCDGGAEQWAHLRGLDEASAGADGASVSSETPALGHSIRRSRSYCNYDPFHTRTTPAARTPSPPTRSASPTSPPPSLPCARALPATASASPRSSGPARPNRSGRRPAYFSLRGKGLGRAV